ncbi:oxidoreductase [Thioclava sp. SK-1]|nr:oxidoreductase [Thioclava sp. SK-1]
MAQNLWRHCDHVDEHAAPLDMDMDVDLAVIGGGFTGCAAALEAARMGAKVAVIEAHTVGHGGSGRNVGLVNAGVWLLPETVQKQLGPIAAKRLLSAFSTGPEQVFDLIAREEISCEVSRTGTVHLAHAPAAVVELHDRQRQSAQTGRQLEILSAAQTRQITGSQLFHSGLYDPGAGTIQPLAYVRGLARAAQRRGAYIFQHSPVTRFKSGRDGWRLTVRGHQLRADKLLIATNAYHEGFDDPQPPKFVPISYSQFATAPLSADLLQTVLPTLAGCWDTALVMSSFRLDQAGRLILGAIGNLHGACGRIHHDWARRKLAQIFPQLAGQRFQHNWRGTIAMTRDHLPKILSIGHNAYRVFGYSGRGICPGTLFGTALAEALLIDSTAPLPLLPTRSHTEPYARLRGRYYETGATAIHALSPAPWSRPPRSEPK